MIPASICELTLAGLSETVLFPATLAVDAIAVRSITFIDPSVGKNIRSFHKARPRTLVMFTVRSLRR